MEKYEKRAVNNYLHMKGHSVQKIYLDMREYEKMVLPHKQQSTGGPLLYSVVNSRLKASTVLVTCMNIY